MIRGPPAGEGPPRQALPSMQAQRRDRTIGHQLKDKLLANPRMLRNIGTGCIVLGLIPFIGRAIVVTDYMVSGGDWNNDAEFSGIISQFPDIVRVVPEVPMLATVAIVAVGIALVVVSRQI